MDFTDHSKGWPKATKASFNSGIPRIHHNKCGGRVIHHYNKDGWGCLKCDAGWHEDIVARWTDNDVEIRFHLRGDVDENSYTIMWVTTGKNRHTTLVRSRDADNLPVKPGEDKPERFVL